MNDKNTYNLSDILKENGYKLTNQRKVIYNVFLDNEHAHLSPEEIYDKVRDKHPEIGIATVYRTLQLLEDLDVLYKVNFDDGCSRYELNQGKDKGHHHHHLICLECGKVTEVELDLLENLEEEIEKSGEFKIVDHILKFYGYCKSCKK
ncbi:Fur family transcriptional regulator [Clostridiaceae bacterium M8S5]|nr:Fur family transcriptional regulator [Clostridiaceae bacterium M8S5]